MHRNIHPLGFRVVIKLREVSNTTESGLYLPPSSREDDSSNILKRSNESVLGEVIEVASVVDRISDEETNISGVPFGSLVLIQKDAGIKVPWDSTLRIVESKEVLAVVSELETS